MKVRILFFALLTLAIVSGCSDNNNETNTSIVDGDNSSVFLQINNKKASTRADIPSATDSTAQLLSAIIYFLDDAANPVIYDIRTVGAGGADATIAELEAGVEFENVPSVVTQVYIVGNYNSSDVNENTATFPQFAGLTLDDIENTVLNIEQVSYPLLSNGTGTTGLLTVMTGSSDVITYGSNQAGWGGNTPLSATDLYADVTLIPVVARLEIVEITYDGTALASFTLEGIYINNYYQQVNVDLDYTGFTETNNGSDTTLYSVSNAAFAYTDYSTLYDIINDDATVVNDEATVDPANGTWAYQVFGNAPNVPHIILKLTNVTTTDGTLLGTRYVTVTGYQNGNATVNTFVPNTIYKINNLTFTDDDISLIPEPENVSIWVHVDVQPWETVIVTPVI